jgi:hypothetical protein
VINIKVGLAALAMSALELVLRPQGQSVGLRSVTVHPIRDAHQQDGHGDLVLHPALAGKRCLQHFGLAVAALGAICRGANGPSIGVL